MHMINCLVKRLPAYGFERLKTARFDIFPQRFSNEFQVFNVFHNRLNRSVMRDKFFQPLGADFGVRFLLFPSIDRSQGPFFVECRFITRLGFPLLSPHVLRVGAAGDGGACFSRDFPRVAESASVR
jgi:hypothetical protein